ncbi:MAG: class I SAM-dependent methyltransferase, partial [Clostridiales Family XIII bacterium]|nr:class I SAM-dependent methyltransferase [Clostridiales Family XIII bacterium]
MQGKVSGLINEGEDKSMNEASKTKKKFGQLEQKIFKGEGIDIGCGGDPIYPDAQAFDKEDGDANNISKYVKKQFDYVFSSHCLEHMLDPYHALNEWWKLVKPGGYLFVVVPDEDLYEQGQWPSQYNKDHKYTFTIYKE